MGQTTSLIQLRKRLKSNELCLLDGAVGTELERRGYSTYLPLWTAKAIYDCPDLLREIHSEYIDAGVDIITANTFRTSGYTLEKAGIRNLARGYTLKAVEIAREAVNLSKRQVIVAGSLAPLEDCYSPELVPDPKVVRKEFAAQLDILNVAEIDLVLLETMINRSEVEIIIELLSQRQMPFIISFTADENGKLLDGTPLSSIIPIALQANPIGILLNCRAPKTITQNLKSVGKHSVPFGAYGNGAGKPGGPTGWVWNHNERSDSAYLTEAMKWYRMGARIIGGCCGTSPTTIQMLSKLKS